MKRILVILCLLASHSFLKCQITMQTNLPRALPLNSEITFEVKIKKGNSANFAKYQMEIPRGSVVKEVDVKSGSFTFEDNIVKIIWVMAPIEPEFSISLKLNTGVVAGKKIFGQKYFYVENDDKKEVEMEPVLVMFKDSAGGNSVSTAEFVTVIPKALPSLLTTTINAAEISTKNPALLIQQVLQLRKDSRDAYAVGEREKKKAEGNLSQANDALQKADAITNEAEKTAAQEKAVKAKLKAENDLEVAERVIILAKSLEDNANEIDAINKSVNPDSYSTDPKIAAGNTRKNASASEGKEEISTTVNLDEPEENKSVEKRSKAKKEKEAEPEPETESAKESGLIYKIQLGAFSKEPSKKDFKAIGKVKILEESGMYKVLYGSYTSKDEAFKQREQIIGKGFDGFVVSYQDGVRVNK